jgi:hypothetical protein
MSPKYMGFWGAVVASSEATEPQPIPSGKGVDVAELVHSDIEARCEYGVKKYGERLTTRNGRDALADAYQEVLDLAMYLQCIYGSLFMSEATKRWAMLLLSSNKPFQNIVIAPDRVGAIKRWLLRNGYIIEFEKPITYAEGTLLNMCEGKINIGARKVQVMEEPRQTACPRCGALYYDYDGFGVLHCSLCGWCAHASTEEGVCTMCGKRIITFLKPFGIFLVGFIAVIEKEDNTHLYCVDLLGNECSIKKSKEGEDFV